MNILVFTGSINKKINTNSKTKNQDKFKTNSSFQAFSFAMNGLPEVELTEELQNQQMLDEDKDLIKLVCEWFGIPYTKWLSAAGYHRKCSVHPFASKRADDIKFNAQMVDVSAYRTASCNIVATRVACPVCRMFRQKRNSCFYHDEANPIGFIGCATVKGLPWYKSLRNKGWAKKMEEEQSLFATRTSQPQRKAFVPAPRLSDALGKPGRRDESPPKHP